MEEAEVRFDECVEVMTKAWTLDTPWSHRGTYWQFEDVVVEPPTARSPIRRCGWAPGAPRPSKKCRAGLQSAAGPICFPGAGERGITLFKAEVEAQGRTFDPMSVGSPAP